MCGIVGATGPAATSRVQQLVARIRHRGPDGSGLWYDDGVALGHTRLAILDPSERSAQPFRRGPFTIIYNGEIYNHVELRAWLRERGARFTTDGDTEVLIELIAREGFDALRHIEGMFAFALWDQRDSSLTLARDRHGIKPLYWKTRPGGIEFASELSPLADDPRADVDSAALRDFLRFGAPVGSSIIHGIHEIAPGTHVRHARSTITSRRFDGAEPNLEHAMAPVDALHTSIVQHARSDRPLALFLSGGFDSAAVLRGLRDGGSQPLCFTLGTADNGEEVARARKAASHYGVDHEVVPIDESRLAASIGGFLDAMDQPGIDGFNTYLISQISRDHGCPVALSGLGGDEVLGGYRYYNAEDRMRQLEPMLGLIPDRLKAHLVSAASRVSRKSSARIEAVALATGTAARHRGFRTLFTDAEVESLTGQRPAASWKWDTDPRDDARHQLASLDRLTYLRPTLLRDADVYSMWHGVELRVPFVDTRVVESVLTTGSAPTKLELATAWNDRFLIEKASEQKLTFRLPWNRWLNALRLQSAEVLSQPEPWHGLVDSARARHLVSDDAVASAEPLRPWSLLVLAHWFARRDQPRLTEAVSLLQGSSLDVSSQAPVTMGRPT